MGLLIGLSVPLRFRLPLFPFRIPFHPSGGATAPDCLGILLSFTSMLQSLRGFEKRTIPKISGGDGGAPACRNGIEQTHEGAGQLTFEDLLS